MNDALSLLLIVQSQPVEFMPEYDPHREDLTEHSIELGEWSDRQMLRDQLERHLIDEAYFSDDQSNESFQDFTP